jgi:hypothetical protein
MSAAGIANRSNPCDDVTCAEKTGSITRIGAGAPELSTVRAAGRAESAAGKLGKPAAILFAIVNATVVPAPAAAPSSVIVPSNDGALIGITALPLLTVTAAEVCSENGASVGDAKGTVVKLCEPHATIAHPQQSKQNKSRTRLSTRRSPQNLAGGPCVHRRAARKTSRKHYRTSAVCKQAATLTHHGGA